MPENFQYPPILQQPSLDLSRDLGVNEPPPGETFEEQSLSLLKNSLEVPSESINAWNNISGVSKQISSFYGNPANISTGIETPYNDAKKFLDMGYGYIQGVDNEDFYSDTQGVIKTLGKGLLRIPALVTTKLGQQIGYIGSMFNPFNWGDNVVANAADNEFSKFFATVEDNVKNDWLRTFNSSEDREKGFFGRMFTDLDFWTDDFVDGAAFMGSAWIPGFALYKLKGGQRIMGALGKIGGKNVSPPGTLAEMESVAAGTNYFTNAQRYARNIDKYGSWAMATTGESLFEASEIKKNVYESLGVDKFGNIAINPQTGNAYTEEEKNKIAANAAQSGFLMNAALLSVTNLFELPYVTKAFGIGKGGLSPLTGATKIGEDLATDVGKNAWQRFMRSNYGAFTKAAGLGIAREGFVEENIQLAIQRINELYGSSGIITDMLDYQKFSGLANQIIDQTKEAVSGNDPIASMNIGLGALLGGGMSGVVDFQQSKRDALKTEEVVKAFNLAQGNWLKFGDIFKKEEYNSLDENGNAVTKMKTVFDSNNVPIVDEEKMASVLSNAKAFAENLGLSQDDDIKSPLLKNILRDESFTKFVTAHINAENEEGLIQKLDALKTSSVEDLAKLGFIKDADFDSQIEKYKRLAFRIINQNKRINDDIIFDNTENDLARKNYLIEMGSKQALYKELINEEQSRYEQLKGELVTPSITSLTDGLVDQLNQIQFRINSQKELIEAIKQSGEKKTYISIQQKVLDNLEETKKNLLTNNETTLKLLTKNEEGFYKYEKEGRNDITISTPLDKKLKLLGGLQNYIDSIGSIWGSLADFKLGRKNFDSLFKETIVDPINERIEEENKNIPATESEDLADTLDLDQLVGEDIGATAPTGSLGEVSGKKSMGEITSLDDYLKQRYEDLKEKGQVDVSYNEWLNSGAADRFVKYYNEKYKTSEVPSPVEEEEETEVPEEVIETEEVFEEDLSEEIGKQSFPSVKIGPYVINVGDKINDEEVTLITEKNVVLGDNIMSYDEVRKTLDAFRGRNLTRKGAKETDLESEEVENGEIIDVQETRTSTLNQKIQEAVNKANGNVVFGGSDKVIQGGSKINNTSDFYIIDVMDGPGGKKRVDRTRTSANPNYPMIMSTPQINLGVNIKLVADTEIKDFREQDLLDPSKTKLRRASDFFDGSKVKESNLSDFPIRIDAEIDGDVISLGYLPTLKWLESRWPDGETMNVVEFITLPSGEKINNLQIQKKKLLETRKSILQGQNKNSKFVMNAVVSGKSDGQLRVTNTFKKLSEVVAPQTKLGIIRNGLIHLENDELLDSSDVVSNFDSFSGKEGWPVVLLPTPSGKTIASFLSVPKLATQHKDFIVAAWKAFHTVKEAKDLNAVKSQVNIVKAVYNALETPYEPGVVIDFNVLKSYINNYITFTSGKQYNPLAKIGTSQFNITENGEMIVWSVKEKTKDKDLVFAKNPEEFAKKEQMFDEKLGELYYNVKTTTEFSQGINSTKPIRFLSSFGDNVKATSSPITYNEYIMGILETNIEPGRPVDPSDKNSELVYFANPVLTFDITKSNEVELEAENKKKNIPPSVGPLDPKVEKLRDNWSLSLDAIRKSTIGEGFATNVYDANNNFTLLTDSTEEGLVKQIEDFYMGQIESIKKPKVKPVSTAPVVTPTPEAPVSDKKAELEKELERLLADQEERLKKLTLGTPIGGKYDLKVGDRFDDDVIDASVDVANNQLDENFNPSIAENDGAGYSVVSKIYQYGEMENGKVSKRPSIEITTFNTKAEADAFIEQKKIKNAENKAKLGSNKQIDAVKQELAALEGKSVSGSNYKDLKVGQVLNITSKADPSVTGIFTVSEIEKPDFIRFDMDISDGTKETGIGYSEKEFNELFEVKKSVKPSEGLAGLAAQAAPETGDLLDLDLDLGDIAEDIGKPDDTGLKSIRTSLKELKKTCD